MHTARRVAAFLLAALCVTSSIAARLDNLAWRERPALKDPKGSGVVVASINPGGMQVCIRKQGTADKAGVVGCLEGNGLVTVEGREGGAVLLAKHHVAAVELPAGDYEVGSWSASLGNASVTSTRELGIKFRVEPGALTYVGSFMLTRGSSGAYRIAIADHAGEDLKKIAEYRQELASMRRAAQRLTLTRPPDPARATSWAYRVYDVRGMAGELGYVSLHEQGGERRLRFTVGQGDTCYDRDLPVTVERPAGKIVIDVPPALRGCAHFRLVINADGTGGKREVMRGGQWTADGFDRVLTARL
jgi:hypothetical protein